MYVFCASFLFLFLLSLQVLIPVNSFLLLPSQTHQVRRGQGFSIGRPMVLSASGSLNSEGDNVGLAKMESLEKACNTVLTRADGLQEVKFQDLLINEKDKNNGLSIIVFLRHFG